MISCLSLALSSEEAECKTHGRQCENSIDLSGLWFSSERYENRYWEFGFLELRAALSLFDTAQWDQHKAERLPTAIVLWSPFLFNHLSTARVTQGDGSDSNMDVWSGKWISNVHSWRLHKSIHCSGAVAQDGKSVQLDLPHVCHPSSAPPQQITAGLINVSSRRTQRCVVSV